MARLPLFQKFDIAVFVCRGDPVERLDMGGRPVNILRRVGAEKVSDVLALGRDDQEVLRGDLFLPGGSGGARWVHRGPWSRFSLGGHCARGAARAQCVERPGLSFLRSARYYVALSGSVDVTFTVTPSSSGSEREIRPLPYRQRHHLPRPSALGEYGSCGVAVGGCRGIWIQAQAASLHAD